MVEPNASASTERSIRLTEAADGTRSATIFMPLACMSLSLISSRTVMPSRWTDGKERTGIAFLRGAFFSFSSQTLAFMVNTLLLLKFIDRCILSNSIRDRGGYF